MRSYRVRSLRPAICIFLFAVVGSPYALSQISSGTASVVITATLTESLTVAATPTSVLFGLISGGTTTGSSAVAITTTWVLASGRSNVIVDAYFSNALAGLASLAPVVNIPTSEVLGQVLTGTPVTFTAFTQVTALGPLGAGLTLFTQPLTILNRAATRTDLLNLEINLATQPLLPAGIYIGTLTIQAQAL